MTTPRAALAVALATVLSLGVPHGAQAAEKGFWGPVPGDQFAMFRELGVTQYQTTLDWSGIAPTRPANPTNPADPAYRWPKTLDSAILQAQQSKMRVMLMVIRSPSWANGGKGAEWAPSPTHFARFVQAAARRYPMVRRWMIWGEPTRRASFKPLEPQEIGQPLNRRQRAAPQRYARLLDRAYGALKRVRRSNVVIGGNSFTAGDIRPANWVKHMKLPNGKPPRLDVYGHNPFCLRTPSLKNPPGPGETVDFSDLGRFQKVVNRAFGRRGKTVRKVPLFLAEFSVPTGLDSEFNYYTTPATQAKFIRAAFRVARQLKVYGMAWIRMYDEPKPDGGGYRSGLVYADGKRKPGYEAFRQGRL